MLERGTGVILAKNSYTNNDQASLAGADSGRHFRLQIDLQLNGT